MFKLPSNPKLFAWQDIPGLRRGAWKLATLVFTNGCFDLLHPGHVHYLQQAKDLGTTLVVGLNSDQSVRRLKGPDRPVHTEQARAYVLAGLSCVDHIFVFGQDTPYELIQAIRPQILVKGGDWPASSIVGGDIVRGSGGQVHSLPLLPGYSTTKTLNKILEPGEQR
jgi:rfaE bifunctional protein nucleotidyltransferase chain/domain